MEKFEDKFVTKELCDLKMEKLKSVETDIFEIHRKLDNHLVHIVKDITDTKSDIAVIKNSLSFISRANGNKVSERKDYFNGNAFASKKVITVLSAIILLLIAFIGALVR